MFARLISKIKNFDFDSANDFSWRKAIGYYVYAFAFLNGMFFLTFGIGMVLIKLVQK